MNGWEDDEDLPEVEEWERREARPALSPAGIAEQNETLLHRYRDFRRAADAVAAAWRERPEVMAVALIGSLAVAPWKEVPRYSTYRRADIALWHEVGDLDLAVWLSHTRGLDGLRRAKGQALRRLQEESESAVASHHVDGFLLDHGTDRYLGRLCEFNRCPKGKPDCRAEGCGAVPFLRQIEGFGFRPETVAEERAVHLFDRASGVIRRAADLPLPTDDVPGDQPSFR